MHLIRRFQTEESRVGIEGEVEFVIMHDVHDNHLMLAQPELLQRRLELLHVRKEV